MNRRQFLEASGMLIASLYASISFASFQNPPPVNTGNTPELNACKIKDYIEKVKNDELNGLIVTDNRDHRLGPVYTKGVVITKYENIYIALNAGNNILDGSYIIISAKESHAWIDLGIDGTAELYYLNGKPIWDPSRINELYPKDLEFILNHLP